MLDADATPGRDRRASSTSLRRIARERGFAVGSATAFPASIDRIAAFADRPREHGIAIVPVSAARRERADRGRDQDDARPALSPLRRRRRSSTAQGLVWVGRRSDEDAEGEGEGEWWQMPQGGLDDGRGPR